MQDPWTTFTDISTSCRNLVIEQHRTLPMRSFMRDTSSASSRRMVSAIAFPSMSRAPGWPSPSAAPARSQAPPGMDHKQREKGKTRTQSSPDLPRPPWPAAPASGPAGGGGTPARRGCATPGPAAASGTGRAGGRGAGAAWRGAHAARGRAPSLAAPPGRARPPPLERPRRGQGGGRGCGGAGGGGGGGVCRSGAGKRRCRASTAPSRKAGGTAPPPAHLLYCCSDFCFILWDVPGVVLAAPASALCGWIGVTPLSLSLSLSQTVSCGMCQGVSWQHLHQL